MYFSNWHVSPRIERAGLDGYDRMPLVLRTGRVNGLTIDFQDQRLYWASVDSRVIESSNLLGEDRREVVRGLMHPFSLTQYQDFIYWADWNSKSIERANKSSGNNRTKIQEKMDFIMDILIFHNSRQSG
jgi:low density lipoprotein receptor-related protein 5/6